MRLKHESDRTGAGHAELVRRALTVAYGDPARSDAAYVLGPYLCPHRFGSSCPCAKPNPTLYLQASREHDIDCAQSYVVGDMLDDMVAAHHIGAEGCLVLTGWGQAARDQGAGHAVHIGSDVRAVANWIIRDAEVDESRC